jgi:hypothetical protein
VYAGRKPPVNVSSRISKCAWTVFTDTPTSLAIFEKLMISESENAAVSRKREKIAILLVNPSASISSLR